MTPSGTGPILPVRLESRPSPGCVCPSLEGVTRMRAAVLFLAFVAAAAMPAEYTVGALVQAIADHYRR